MESKLIEDAVGLGTWLGRKQAFGAIAGRCSAADAECLRQMREQKTYLALGLNWEQFCKERVGMSRAKADRVIRQLEEFGPKYFELAAVLRIAPEQYRLIAPAVTDSGVVCGGDTIEIRAENAPRLAEAVESLSQSAGAPPCAPAPAQPSGDLVRTWLRARKALAGAVEVYNRAFELATAEHDRLSLCNDLATAHATLAAKMRR
jgi:hypothetical protein